MRFFSSAILAATAFVSAVSAAQYNITVGKDNSNTFDPTSISNVQNGDTLTFRFVSKSHSVTQSTFDKPCTAREPGVDSGFFPVEPGATVFPEWTIRIDNTTAPLWFFCNRSPHCTAGMVFAINPTAERTFDTFQAIARGETSAPAAAPTPSPTDSTATPQTGAASSLLAHKFTTVLAAAGLVAALAL
jgi:hypothetical protein